MYDSPVIMETVMKDISEKIDKRTGEMIIETAAELGVTIDEKKLVQALTADKARYTEAYKKGYNDGLDMINEMVIRCKDCKRRDEEITIPAPDGSKYKSFTFASCPCKSFNLGDDFFCSKGERKDGEQDG